MEKDQKVYYKYIDGIKGLACIGVLLYHFYTSFWQQVSFADSSFMTVLFDGVLKPFIDGTFWVYVFALISGWLVSQKIESLVDLIKKVLLRYVRFAVPLFSIMAIIKIMNDLNLFFTSDAYSLLEGSSVGSVYNFEMTCGGGTRSVVL